MSVEKESHQSPEKEYEGFDFVFKIFPSAITTVTWSSINFVAVYIFFSDVLPSIPFGENSYIAKFFISINFLIVSVGSCAIVNVAFFKISLRIIQLFNVKDSKRRESIVPALPYVFILHILFITYLLSVQILNALGYVVSLNFIKWF